MNAFWSYFWPPLGAGMAVGILAGAFGFRRRARRNLSLAVGFAAALLVAALWHGPLGAADRLAGDIERRVRATMVFYEIPQVNGHLHHGPLTRHVTLAGPADDFQKSELVRLVNDISGVSGTSWNPREQGVPLLAEGAAAALLGFLFGLLVAYLVELRRRYNAQWTW